MAEAKSKKTKLGEVDSEIRALLAKQSEAAAQAAMARARYEEVRAELFRSKIPLHDLVIDYW